MEASHEPGSIVGAKAQVGQAFHKLCHRAHRAVVRGWRCRVALDGSVEERSLRIGLAGVWIGLCRGADGVT
jgi:hypothetical protein